MERLRRLLLAAIVLTLLLGSIAAFVSAGFARAEGPEPPPTEEPASPESPPPAGEEDPAEGTPEAGYCSTGPVDVPEGMAEPQREVRLLRNDERHVCEQEERLGSRQIEILEEIATETRQLIALLGPEGSLVTALQSIDSHAAAIASEQCTSPCEVHLTQDSFPLSVESANAGGEGDPSGVNETLVEGFESLRFPMWFIAALVVAASGAYVLVRLVIFRDN